MQLLKLLVSAFLFQSVFVTALPLPDFKPGDMVRARPKHWGDENKKAGKHFGVVVGKNQDNHKYKVAHTSHNLPANRYPHQDDAIKYHKKFGDTKINTGKPVEVAQHHLHPASPQQGWHKMADHELASLKKQINTNCPDAHLRKRGIKCDPRNKAPQNTGHKPAAPSTQKGKHAPKPHLAKSVGRTRLVGNKKPASGAGRGGAKH